MSNQNMGSAEWGDYPQLTAVEKLQEKYYLAAYNQEDLIKRLEKVIFDLPNHHEKSLEAIFIVRMLKDVADPKLPEALLNLIDKSFGNVEEADSDIGTELWVSDIGRVLITEFLDVIFEYKRPADIPRIIRLATWDLFHIPSHIFLLIRKHRWRELQDTINSRYDIREEYDQMIRTQHFLTEEALKNENFSEGDLLIEKNKELLALRSSLSNATKPVLYVEGKTDRIILNTAYKKLYPAEEAPFVIKECDVVDGHSGGAGGAQTLSRLISTIRKDSAHAALALFDNDREGIDAYNRLPKYFRNRDESGYRPGKLSDSGRAAALIIPPPADRLAYANLMNLPIEFLFDDDVLDMKNESGHGLILRYPEVEIRVKGGSAAIIETKRSTIPETREVGDGKVVFASEIVPKLDASKFERFKPLFWVIKDILISEMKSPASLTD
jgi:hypothetical protein